MIRHLSIGALAAACLAAPALSQSSPYPRAGFRANLSTIAHDVDGFVTILDQDTLLVENFDYDGGGISVYFYLGAQNNANAFTNGLQIGPQLLGTVFDDETLTLDLPPGATLDGYNAISVWCVAAGVSFGQGAFFAQPPQTYCTAKVNSQGCTPQIQFSGSPSASSAAPFSIGATQVINEKSGLLVYGLAADNLPFQGGVLCVGAPRRRTPLQMSGGNSGATDCSGVYSFDFRARIQSGVDSELVAGAEVFAQYWQRDPLASFGVGLTAAIAFHIAP
jgi:hypothetical protein